ncbi:uncharacterized protein TRIADDRAFT_62244 [Trichoplax adhaerens]|uniref:Ig-like domain-containing protein n=1 Tax=Trichoplax adhaerens TaxID=10228 RepID=B3SD87_TRIAD|nr:hypothetical protein TRIADDRAFT_62244 [Trichoplax adhaerens]EDV19297.1 hypothetical protein TRIADDRAFT_62244 [Trichoplax adhaerens]|eukprot:XP_002118221.1 hypothetical protein TRIADDRAFT_62244 [Trichoplax adhaerens]
MPYIYSEFIYDLEITVSHIQIHPNFSMDQSKQVIALECTAYGWPLPALSWWIGKEMITSSYHATLVTSNPKLYQNKLTLIFKSFSSADNNGSYWCKGINSISEARSIKDITLGNCHQSNICLHGKCYQRKGRFYCSCDKNYTGNKCQTFLCDLRVGSKVDYFSCNNSDGKPNCNCSHGTETWFVTPSSKYLLTGIIIGGLIDAMAILILLVIGVILYRRFRRQSVPRYLLDDQDVNELL